MKSSLLPLWALLLLSATTALAQRDPYKWPFAKTSIWNIPIHNNATYAPATIQDAANFAVDEDVIIMRPAAPLMRVETNNAGWSQSKDRCLDEGPTLYSAPIPAEWIYDKTVWEGVTPNAGVAIAYPDNSIIQSQPFAKCNTQFATSGNNIWPAADCQLTGECIRGAHGGSGLSAIGGAIRVGELRSGKIPHALKINLWGKENFYRDGSGGHRWPAYKADGGFDNPSEGNYYGGTNPEMKIGALLALGRNVVLNSVADNSLGLETEAALIIARAMRDYGAYTVDNTAWDSYAIITEIGPDGSVRDEFKNLYGLDMNVYGGLGNSAWGRDLKKLFGNLQVITNNSQANPGGGPASDLANRRAAAAPDFLPTRTFRIMPLGDSKTEGGGGGNTQNSWRGYLRTRLIRAGYKVDYVGDRSNLAAGDTLPNDNDHAGHGGYTIGPDTQRFCPTCETTGIFEHIQDWLPAADPDIVLLAIGVNDMFGDGNHPPNYRATAPDRYQALVDKILQLKPGVRLVLGTVEPVKWDRNWGSNPNDNSLGALNARIRAIANASETDNIFLADIFTKMSASWDPGDFFDDLHLSRQGAIKDANAWLEAVVPVLNNTPENVPPTVTLTLPAPNAPLAAPASVTLAVSATDADGTVAKVEYFNNKTKIGESTTAPFSLQWQGVDEGTYLVSAVATDNLFARAVSATDTVRVSSTDGYVRFTGTGIGSPGSYGNSGNTFAKALDGDIATYFDGASPAGQWVGLDLGIAKKVRKVKLVPRSTWASRIVGGIIQGANSPDFADAVSLFGFTEVPAEGIYTVARFDNQGLYRYYRFLSPASGYGNINELEFWGNPSDPTSQPPLVTLDSTLDNNRYAPGSSVNLAATATDPDGTIAKVEFFAGTTLIGTDTQAPYSFLWTSVPAGTYSVTARATDNTGVSANSNAARIRLDSAGSDVLYAESFDANTAAGWVANGGTWTAAGQRYESTNTNGEFTSFYNGASFCNYTYSLDATAIWNNDIGAVFNYQNQSNYYILVINTNSKSAQLKKRVNGTLATLASATFTGGGTGTRHTLSIANSGGVTTVQINGAVVFDKVATTDFACGKIGLYSFYCPSRFDNIVVQSNNALPSVSLTGPASGATFAAPASVTLTATASDPDGTVARVDFYNGPTLLGTASASPYTFVWNSVAAGSYVLTAKATDNAGAAITSSALPLTVTASLADAVGFVNPPLALKAGQTYTVNVSYAAAGPRIIDVYLFTSDWKTITSKNVAVGAGAGTQAVSLTVPANAAAATGARWSVSLWTSNWSTIVKTSTAGGVTLTASGGTANGTTSALTFTSVCSSDPSITRRWRVTNNTAQPVAFQWRLYQTTQTGTGSVEANGTVFFETQTVQGPNTTVIEYGSNGSITKASSASTCASLRTGAQAEDGSETQLGLYPNPTSDRLTVSYHSQGAGRLKLTLADRLSRTRLAQEHALTAGVNEIVIRTKELESGVYVLMLQDGNRRTVRKVIVQR